MENTADSRNTILSETDVTGKIIFVNDNFCRISRYDYKELIGQPHSIVRHPEMPGKLFTLLWQGLAKGNVFRGILKNLAKDGSHYWVRITIMPVYDHQKDIVRFIGSAYHLKDDRIAEGLYHEQVKLLKL